MKLNLGCGAYPLPGYVNIDEHTDCDVRGDVRELEFSDCSEVRMSHLLEHISWRETQPVLSRIRSWMAPKGFLVVEVPDMDAILGRGTVHPLWFKYVYGDQSHLGEYHLAGFTESSLTNSLYEAGWSEVSVRVFESDHRGREGMPCLEATAWAS